MASKTQMIHARIEPKLKKSVEAIFSKLGLNTTDAICLFFKQVELNRGLPFAVKIPNKETRQAIKDLRKAKRPKIYHSADDVMRDLLK
jgi:DNA-damage-inducible protein J